MPHTSRTSLWVAAFVFMVVVLRLHTHWQDITNTQLFDVVHSYGPAGQFILNHGLGRYVASHEALRIPLLAALWHALWQGMVGQELIFIRYGHALLNAATIAILATLAYRLSVGMMPVRLSALTAVLTALLWAHSPLITPYADHAIMEMPFWFFTSLWLLLLARYWQELTLKRTFILVIFGGIAMGLRPLYLVPVLMLGLGFTLWSKDTRRLGLALLTPLPLVVLLMSLNYGVHGLFGLSTGSGAALFMGLHPHFAGVDPPVFLYNFDANLMVNGDHLSLTADHTLRTMAKRFAAEMSLLEWWQFGWAKLKLSLFLGREEGPNTTHAIAWRMVLISLSLVGAWALRHSHFGRVLVLIALLALGQTLPILHNTRYSAGSLELFLTIFAAIGTAHLFSAWQVNATANHTGIALGLSHPSGHTLWRLLGLVLFLIVLVAMYQKGVRQQYAYRSHKAQELSNERNAPRWQHTLWSDTAPRPVLASDASVLHDSQVVGQSPIFAANYQVRFDPVRAAELAGQNAFWLIELSSTHKDCRQFEAHYSPSTAKSPEYTEPILITTANEKKVFILSATPRFSNVAPVLAAGGGQFRLVAKCRANTVNGGFILHRLSLSQSTVVRDGRRQLNLQHD